jgi:hypothetical protein
LASDRQLPPFDLTTIGPTRRPNPSPSATSNSSTKTCGRCTAERRRWTSCVAAEKDVLRRNQVVGRVLYTLSPPSFSASALCYPSCICERDAQVMRCQHGDSSRVGLLRQLAENVYPLVRTRSRVHAAPADGAGERLDGESPPTPDGRPALEPRRRKPRLAASPWRAYTTTLRIAAASCVADEGLRCQP